MACVYFVFISSQIPDLFHLEHFIENTTNQNTRESFHWLYFIQNSQHTLRVFQIDCVGHCTFYGMISKRYTAFSRGKLWNIPFVTCLFFVDTLTSVKVSIGLCVYGDVPTSASDLWDIPWYITQSVEKLVCISVTTYYADVSYSSHVVTLSVTQRYGLGMVPSSPQGCVTEKGTSVLLLHLIC